jgi:hypothetical protein
MSHKIDDELQEPLFGKLRAGFSLFFGRLRSDMGMRVIAIALLPLAVSLSIGVQAQEPASPNAELPAGAMQAKATTACTECHEARIILQQRLSKAAWGKEVDKMMKWGAVVDAADHDALIDYLSANFSTDKPGYEAQRTSNASRKAAK